MDKKRYQYLVKTKQPKKTVARNAVLAFFIGGLICVIGQLVLDFFEGQGYAPTAATAPTAVVMVLLAAIATSLGVYDKLVQVAGMGGSLPITGFANAVVAPAMEFRREGMVLGTGARMFQVAGPVIAFGFGTAFVIGIIHALWQGIRL